MPESNADVSDVTSKTDVTNAPRIAIHPCLKRHRPDSRFSHFTGSDQDLIQLVTANFHGQIPGRYEGSLAIIVPPAGKFFASVSRDARPYEDLKSPAAAVHIILHSRQRLEEVDGETHLVPEADWFIVSINAYPSSR